MTTPKFIMGRKMGMTHLYRGDGEAVPVTVVSATPNKVSQVKTVENDGYAALQVAFEECREKVLSKPRLGHLAKAGIVPKGTGEEPKRLTGRILREVRPEEASDLKVGDEIKVDTFEIGDRVDVIGLVKGRGFAGTVRAHNFAIKRMTHGGMEIRAPGSIGMHSQPGEVLKNKKMPTHWGDERSTVRNLEVVDIDVENNALVIRGAIPGSRGSLVTVRKAVAWRQPKGS